MIITLANEPDDTDNVLNTVLVDAMLIELTAKFWGAFGLVEAMKIYLSLIIPSPIEFSADIFIITFWPFVSDVNSYDISEVIDDVDRTYFVNVVPALVRS